MTTLVLLPGLDGTEVFFAPLLRHLPSWIKPLVIRYPVSGRNDYENLLLHVHREVGALERFAVLGWSFGGPLALMLANDRPAQVSAIILCASFVTAPHPRLVPYCAAVRAPLVAMTRALRRSRLLIPGYASTELRVAKAETWRRVGSGALAARSRAALRVDARPQLQRCQAPLLYLASTRDEVVGRSSLDQIRDLAPKTQVVQLEGKHLALFNSPAAAALGITQFLSDQQIAAPPEL